MVVITFKHYWIDTLSGFVATVIASGLRLGRGKMQNGVSPAQHHPRQLSKFNSILGISAGKFVEKKPSWSLHCSFVRTPEAPGNPLRSTPLDPDNLQGTWSSTQQNSKHAWDPLGS